MLLPTDPKDPNQSAAVKKFFDWGFAHGNDIATQLLYIPLPASGEGRRPGRLEGGVAGHDVKLAQCSKPSLHPGRSTGADAPEYQLGDAIFAIPRAARPAPSCWCCWAA